MFFALFSFSLQIHTRRRWPLFRPLARVHDWFSTYSALTESSFCLTCIYQMGESLPPTADLHPSRLREKRLTHDLRGLVVDPLDGELIIKPFSQAAAFYSLSLVKHLIFLIFSATFSLKWISL